MKFESLNLNPDILRGIIDAGFEHCTPIQEQSLAECLAGKDVIAQSQTGSGKTAVFLLTIFSRVLASRRETVGKPVALVMVPTRELASQVVDDAAKLGKYIPVRAAAIYGGVEYNKQLDALKNGVELIVATPGRMIDLYKSKALSLDDIEIFVIDEADRMFDMGFAPDVMFIAEHLPKKKPRQTMLFSATIDTNVRRLASRYMKPKPVMIEIEPEQLTVSTIDQKVIYVSNKEKVSILLTLLKRPEVERGIIFTNMKVTAERVGSKLAANGVPVKVLTGDVTQERRQKIIEGMKQGKVRMLVATDVAARGLHIDGVTHVFNYDLPEDAANYVHRIGRTARAGKSGKAYSLVCEDHALNLPEIEKYLERKLESEWIEDAELVKDIAPDYRARPRGDKPTARPDKKPTPSGHKESKPVVRHVSTEKKETPQPVKKAGPLAGERRIHRPEKKAGHSGPKGSAQGQEAKKEGGPRQRTDRPRGPRKPVERHVARTAEKPKDSHKPVEKPITWTDERAASAHAPAKALVAPMALQETALAPKEKKTGLLKRLKGFFKK